MSETEQGGGQSAESDAGRCAPEDHDWVFDGYFWHHCDKCGAVS